MSAHAPSPNAEPAALDKPPVPNEFQTHANVIRKPTAYLPRSPELRLQALDRCHVLVNEYTPDSRHVGLRLRVACPICVGDRGCPQDGMIWLTPCMHGRIRPSRCDLGGYGHNAELIGHRLGLTQEDMCPEHWPEEPEWRPGDPAVALARAKMMYGREVEIDGLWWGFGPMGRVAFGMATKRELQLAGRLGIQLGRAS